jgi:hypothetical protein
MKKRRRVRNVQKKKEKTSTENNIKWKNANRDKRFNRKNVNGDKKY